MPNLSVIIPVYNSGKYLKKSLDSVRNLNDTEIIVVNDGSEDNSEEIISEYAKTQSNIVYYKKEHTGVADTRNFGIDHSTGKYILFVDADDYIEPDLSQKLTPYILEKMDVIKFKLKRVDKNGNTLEKVGRSCF